MGTPPVSQRGSESQALPPGLGNPWGTLAVPYPMYRWGMYPWVQIWGVGGHFGQLLCQVHLPYKDQTAGVKKLNCFTEKKGKHYLNTKYSFICHWRLHMVISVCSLFFFSRRYLHLHLFTAWLYLHSQEYSIRNTKYREKKFLKRLVPEFRKIITQGNDKSLQCWAYRCSFDTKSSSRLELH